MTEKDSKAKAKIPTKIHNLTNRVLKSPLVHNRDYQGQKEIGKQGIVQVWGKDGVDYLVKSEDLIKLHGKPPKVSVSQDKNIKLLNAIIEQQQAKKKTKKAECKFTLKDYAMLRGYSKEEVKKSGKFMEELKRDLRSGAYCSFGVMYTEKNGKRYVVHSSFYTLREPVDKGGDWIVQYNPFYADALLEILSGSAKQYFTHYLKEIADRETTEKPYLHYFYNQLVFRRVNNSCTRPKKIFNLLEEMGINEQFLRKPTKCFEILRDCIVYISTNYPEELSNVVLSESQKKGNCITIKDPKSLADSDFKRFKHYLKIIDKDDIRETYISFCHESKKTPLEKKTLTAKPWLNKENSKITTDDKLIDDIIKWAIDWEKVNKYKLKGTKEEWRKFLEDSVSHLGAKKVSELFKEQDKVAKPSALDFLRKILPNEIKKLRKK